MNILLHRVVVNRIASVMKGFYKLKYLIKMTTYHGLYPYAVILFRLIT